MLKIIIKRILRSPAVALAVVGFAIIMSAALTGLNASSEAAVRTYEESYSTIPVTLTVTNLTGTRSDGLEAPSWVYRTFIEQGTGLGVYVKNVYTKMVICEGITGSFLNGSYVLVDTIKGIMSREQEMSLSSQKGNAINWLDGYDEDVFLREEFLCVVPDGILPDGSGEYILHLDMMYDVPMNKSIPTTYYSCDLKVVGTYSGDGHTVYTSCDIVSLIRTALGMPLKIDAVTATVKDNRLLDEVRVAAEKWFVEPDLTGERIRWGYGGYFYYPYALDIDDSQLIAAAQTMENSLLINDICTVLVFILSAGAGFFVGFLMIRNRKREIILMRTVGTSNGKVYLNFIFEQMICFLIGTAVGGAIFLWQPTELLGIFAGIYFIGLSVALAVFLNGNLLSSIKEDE